MLKTLRQVLGALLMVGSIGIGLYLGLWVCFVGGIVQIVEALKSTPIEAIGVALGLLRFFVASLVGWGSFYISLIIGRILID
jgi:hypothetical protein